MIFRRVFLHVLSWKSIYPKLIAKVTVVSVYVLTLYTPRVIST